MRKKQIFFTAPGIAEIWEQDIPPLGEHDVLVRMEYTVISGGTEKDCLTGRGNTSANGGFPCSLGYCGVGFVREIGTLVTTVKPGDRVLVYHGVHSNWNVRSEEEITKVDNDAVSSLEAAFVIIASMGLGGVRKLELELGESAMIMGQGLLGIFSTQFCRLSGANPVIAADLNPERRKLALALGADYAFDPADPHFIDHVKEATHGRGINGCVEVTGVSAAMLQAMDCAAFMGRISLLGCTRVSDSAVDYYKQVHRPGLKLIGAHNFVRPKYESYPHHWTHHDDCRAILEMIAAGRVQVAPIISRVVKPEEAPEVYHQLATDPLFPMGTVFDWRS